jgi:uncharacterized damage-inducible protein DinB
MNTQTTALASLFDRDIKRLEDEIKLYTDDNSLWKIDHEIRNSAGNLCLHLCGNLQTYIGKNLGGIEYQRNRDLEFSAKNVPKEKLLSEILKTKEAVKSAFTKLSPEDVDKTYPEIVFDKPMTTGFFLTHLLAHLSYHLGQINYHRRLLCN